MVKISGLDNLQRTLKDAEKAFSALDGELGAIQFDPHDPASIEGAIQQASKLVDDRVGALSSNPIVKPMAEALKDRYRAEILERAAAARLGSREQR